LAGAPPQTPLGEFTALPRPPSWNLGVLLLRGRGRDERRREEGEVGEGRKRERVDEEGEGGGRSPPSMLKLAPRTIFVAPALI